MLNVPESLSATEQSILSTSVVSKTIFTPDNSSSEVPAGITTSFARIEIPFAVLLFTALFDVSLWSYTSAVTADVWIFVSIKPKTTVVVDPATVYIEYAVPAEAGSAAKFTTLNVFAIYYILLFIVYYTVF